MADTNQDKTTPAKAEQAPVKDSDKQHVDATDGLTIEELESAAGGYADESLDNSGCVNALAKCG